MVLSACCRLWSQQFLLLFPRVAIRLSPRLHHTNIISEDKELPITSPGLSVQISNWNMESIIQ